MKEIYIFKNGKTIQARIEKLFETFGPYTIEGRRLDLLTKVQLLVDSSTTSTYQSGTNTSIAKTGSMVGRAVMGGVLIGGVGAVIGGLSGKRESVINTVNNEILHTELTAELIFEDGYSLYVLLKDKGSFHWLLSFVNQTPLTDEEIEIDREKREKEVERIRLEVERIRLLEEKEDKKSELKSELATNRYFLEKEKREQAVKIKEKFIIIIILVCIAIIMINKALYGGAV